MSNTITEDELLEKAREPGLGTIAAASKWARDNGLTLVPNPVPAANGRQAAELPPVAQGGLSAVTAEDEEDPEAEVGADTEMGGLDYANLDITKLNDPKIFQQLYRDQLASQQRAEQASARLYEEGRKRILEKYAGPSEAERLYALSRAMLSPTDFPGFKGFLGNVVGALGESQKAAREAEQTREQKLFELQQQYQQGEIARAAARPKTALDMARLVATYNKPTGMTYDTQRGVWVNRNDPRPTENTYDIGGGRTLVQWQDGLWREALPNGTYKVFERAGNAFKELRTEGAR